MTLADAVLTIDGKKVQVTNVEMSFEPLEGIAPKVTVEGHFINEAAHWWGGVDVAAKGSDKSVWVHHFAGAWNDEDEPTKKEEVNMCREDRACDGEEGYYGGEQLAQQLKDLELSEDQRTMLKYGLISRNGLITNKGKEVLLNHLLAAYTDELVEELETLEESKKPKEEE